MNVQPDDVTVYTAIFGDRDRLSDDQVTGGSRFTAVLGCRTESKVWNVQLAEGKADRLLARHAKTHPIAHVDTPYSIWVDGSVRVCVPPVDVVRRYLDDCDLAVTRHDARDCAYDEARAVVSMGYEKPTVTGRQITRYRNERFPPHYGLAATWVLVRRHSPECIAFDETWWQEIRRGSVRDQLSFDYCRWKLDFPVKYFDDGEVHRHGWPAMTNPSFRILPHGK